MKSPQILFTIFLSLVNAATCLGKSERPGGLPDLRDLLPRAGEAGEWTPDADIQEYAGEDLFIYINGGAEIYHEYGFVRVIVQDYKSRAGKTIALEIYEMKSPASAYGIFSFKKSADGRDVATDPDSEAQLADYYLNLWKGRYLVTLTGFDETEAVRDGLLLLARASAQRINDRAEKPALPLLLVENGLNKASVRYFLGNLGLFNAYAFDPAGIFAVEEGVKGDYGAGEMAVILKYKNWEDGRTRFSEARKSFAASSRYQDFKESGNSLFSIKDGKGWMITVSHFGKYVLVAVGMEESKARDIFGLIQKKAGR